MPLALVDDLPLDFAQADASLGLWFGVLGWLSCDFPLFVLVSFRLPQPEIFSRPLVKGPYWRFDSSIWCLSWGIGFCAADKKRPGLLLGRRGRNTGLELLWLDGFE